MLRVKAPLLEELGKRALAVRRGALETAEHIRSINLEDQILLLSSEDPGGDQVSITWTCSACIYSLF